MAIRLTVARNFCRFLTKLCDQVVALISDQHSERLVFDSSTEDIDVDFDNSNTANDSVRVFRFVVQQTRQQEDSASGGKGFKVMSMDHRKAVSDCSQFSHPCMSEVTAHPERFEREPLQPILVAGDTFQAILSAEYIPEQFKKTTIDLLCHLAFCDLLK